MRISLLFGHFLRSTYTYINYIKLYVIYISGLNYLVKAHGVPRWNWVCTCEPVSLAKASCRLAKASRSLIVNCIFWRQEKQVIWLYARDIRQCKYQRWRGFADDLLMLLKPAWPWGSSTTSMQLDYMPTTSAQCKY